MTAPLDERFAAEPAALRALRGRVRAALRDLHLQEQDIDTVLLVVDELVSNAIEHGRPYRAGGTPLHVRLEPAGSDLVLEFTDADMPAQQVALMSKAFASNDLELPDLEDERGRGLFLVLISLHDIVVEQHSGGAGGMRLRGRFQGMARP